MISEFITLDNINQIIMNRSFLGTDANLLSIDIDSNDYYILKEIIKDFLSIA